MRKFLSIFMALVMALMLTACATEQPTKSTADITVVTDNFAAYDWTRNIIGDSAIDLVLIGANGADMHSYQPIARDFAELADSDLFIFIGGESDTWARDAIRQTAAKATPLSLLDTIGDSAHAEQISDEMTTDNTDHDDTDLDEHIWLSLNNAITCSLAIAEALGQIDPTNADTYAANADHYTEQLFALDTEYHNTVSAANFDTILVADRFPFIYLTEDLGLNWYAAYPGCSAETGASFETVMTLSECLAELKLPAVITCEKSDTALAKTIISTANLPDTAIITLDSLQSVSQAEIDGGKTYIGAMQNNLAALNSALN